jgi:hypothetical protein
MTNEDRRIRSLRPPKPSVNPWVAHGSLVEDERTGARSTERALTVFLAGAECPFTCSFCDLWRWTTASPTPVGALPAQLSGVLETLARPLPDRVKLYNASNFFDRRAVPPEDVAILASLCDPFVGVTVESHANTIGPPVLDFAQRVSGRLEVAIGLETIEPLAMEHLNKRLDLARFDGAAAFLLENHIDLRVFVLLGAPYIPHAESVDWAVRTAEYAAGHGARVVSLIPLRGGNGEMERLAALGLFVPPTLPQLEEALERCLELPRTIATADLWDTDRLVACTECRADRVERLRQMNLTGRMPPRSSCGSCNDNGATS